MVQVTPAAPSIECPACGNEVPSTLLACPQCHRLVHAARLGELAERAEAATSQGDTATAIAAWQEALALLPVGTRQHDAISARIVSLGREEASSQPRGGQAGDAGQTTRWTWLGGAGAAVIFLVTKGKFLLVGLTKSATLFSMLASFALYWTQWGMYFALGFVLSIYVHEMGHVAALRRYGIPASAPMFVPGLGAFVRMHMRPPTPEQDARVGLAGPVWGLGAAIAAYAGYLVTGNALWAAVAHAGAWINLFNLLPVWQLDGGRAFAALTASQRWLAALIVGVLWVASHEGLLVLLLLGAIGQAWFARTAPQQPDHGALAIFAGLVLALTYLSATSAVPSTPF